MEAHEIANLSSGGKRKKILASSGGNQIIVAAVVELKDSIVSLSAGPEIKFKKKEYS